MTEQEVKTELNHYMDPNLANIVSNYIESDMHPYYIELLCDSWDDLSLLGSSDPGGRTGIERANFIMNYDIKCKIHSKKRKMLHELIRNPDVEYKDDRRKKSFYDFNERDMLEYYLRRVSSKLDETLMRLRCYSANPEYFSPSYVVDDMGRGLERQKNLIEGWLAECD